MENVDEDMPIGRLKGISVNTELALMNAGIETVKDLLDCSTVVLTDKEKFSDRNINDIRSALTELKYPDSAQYLNCVFCCGYILKRRFADVNEAYQTAKALNYDIKANEIGKYMNDKGIRKIPIDVPLLRNISYEIECGVSKYGNLYLKTPDGIKDTMPDSKENRINISQEYNKLIDEEKRKECEDFKKNMKNKLKNTNQSTALKKRQCQSSVNFLQF